MARPKTGVTVELLMDDDVPESFELLSKSFGHDAPFVDIYFPAHDTPAGQEQGSKRLLKWKETSPTSTFLKAVINADDKNQERLIGLAIWTHMREAPLAELDKVENVVEVWPDVEDREFMTQLWADYVVPRTRLIEESKGAGVYVLELLAVHPDFQRLGAGSALVKWGTEAAEILGVTSVVESTPVGLHTYEKCGMRVQISEMPFNVEDKFSNRRKPTLVFLARTPRVKGDDPFG